QPHDPNLGVGRPRGVTAAWTPRVARSGDRPYGPAAGGTRSTAGEGIRGRPPRRRSRRAARPCRPAPPSGRSRRGGGGAGLRRVVRHRRGTLVLAGPRLPGGWALRVLAALAQLAELAADVLEVPAVVSGGQRQRRGEQALSRVPGERAPVDAQVLRSLCGGEELRGGHPSTVGASTGTKLVHRATRRV